MSGRAAWPVLQLTAPEFNFSTPEKLKAWLNAVAELSLKHENAKVALQPLNNPKDAEKSAEAKAAADKLIAQDLAGPASNTYTHAILLSPNNDKLPLLYANRGLAFFKLEAFEQALWDTVEALRIGYPADRAYKLHYRRALILSKLRRCPHCTYAAAEQALASTPADDKEVRSEMEKLKGKIAHPDDKQCEKKPVEGDICKLQLAGGPSEPRGRYLVAPTAFNRGDVVIQEKPAAFAISDIVRTQLCPTCLVKITSPYPCTSCVEFYCSSACCQRDTTHKYFCGSGLYNSPGLLRLVVRILALATPEELATLSAHALESPITIPVPNTIFGRLFGLQVHFGALSIAATHVATDTALCAKALSAIAPFSAVPFDLLHWLAFRTLTQLRANTVGVRETISSADGTQSKEIIIAHAIFPNVSMMNHSCDPNATLTFSGSTVSVRLTEPVAAGTEVNISYGPHRGRLVVQARRQHLSEQYAFHCECRACVSEQAKESLAGFRCQSGKCKSALPESGKCSECGKEHVMADLKRQFDIVSSLFEKISEMEKKEVPPEKRVIIALNSRDTAVRLRLPTDRVIADVCDSLARQLALAKRNVEAAEQVYAAVRVLKLWYPSDSPEVAVELAKAASLLFRSGDPVSALASIREAIAALTVHQHLPAFDTDLKELKRMERSLIRSAK